MNVRVLFPCLALGLWAALAPTPAAAADEFELEPGFVSLYDGRDLTGWTYRDRKTLAVKARFDGKTSTPDGRYAAQPEGLVANPRGPDDKRGRLWTAREFGKDFILKLEFRASEKADSGVFLRGPQLQVRDYLVAGPYRDLASYRPGDWNELVITVKGEVARATCNGEVLEEAIEIPASGPIGIESDRGTMTYRRIRVKELP